MLQTYGVRKNTPQQNFWERLEEASRDVGLPYGLSDIGRELDLWPSAIQKWRDGLNYPGQQNLINLAKNRGVNTEWLLTGRGPKLAESAMDAATRELLQIWNALPDSAQERLLHAARYERTITPGSPTPNDGGPIKPPRRRPAPQLTE